MSVRVLSQYVGKLRPYVQPHGRAIFRVQNLHQANGVPEKEEEIESAQQPQETGGSGDYMLLYNPSAYYCTNIDRSALLGSGAMEDLVQTSVNAPFRQMRNPYSVTCSRRLSSSKNTLLARAFGEAEANKRVAGSPSSDKDAAPDVKGDPRAFQRCRPEYGSVCHDLSLCPPAIQPKETKLLLQKVTTLKGNMGPSEITRLICELGRAPPQQAPLVRGDARFTMLLRYSVESLQDFTNVQLLDVLRACVQLSLPHSHTMLALYETEFCRRAQDMTLHQLLLAADLWRCIGRSVPRYLEQLFDSIIPHFGQMGPTELVQLLYIMGEGRRCSMPLLQLIELRLLRHLDQLQAEEVGTVCLGLFKSQTVLPEATVRRLIDKAYSVVMEMSDFAMVNVLKMLRFSYLDHIPWLEAMGTEVPRRAPWMGIQGVMHVALAFSSLHFRDDRVLLAVAERIPEVSSHCRSKDAAKLLWAFGMLGFPPSQCPDLYSCLMEVMCEREAEFHRYPEHLLTGLLGLAFVGEFPLDLLSLALSPEFVSRALASRKLDLKRDLFTLDGIVDMELPHWGGPRLSRTFREEVTQQLWDLAQRDMCQKPEILEAEAMLQDLLGGERFVRKHMILPHMRSIDLEVYLDADGDPLPVVPETHQENTPWEDRSAGFKGWQTGYSGITLTEDLLDQLTGGRRTNVPPPTKLLQRPALRKVETTNERESIISVGVDLTEGLGSLTRCLDRPSKRGPSMPAKARLAVQVTNRNQYCYHTQQLLGLQALKWRQLELRGYKVVNLPYWEWFPLLRRSRTEKRAYLQCKIFS